MSCRSVVAGRACVLFSYRCYACVNYMFVCLACTAPMLGVFLYLDCGLVSCFSVVCLLGYFAVPCLVNELENMFVDMFLF